MKNFWMNDNFSAEGNLLPILKKLLTDIDIHTSIKTINLTMSEFYSYLGQENGNYKFCDICPVDELVQEKEDGDFKFRLPEQKILTSEDIPKDYLDDIVNDRDNCGTIIMTGPEALDPYVLSTLSSHTSNKLPVGGPCSLERDLYAAQILSRIEDDVTIKCLVRTDEDSGVSKIFSFYAKDFDRCAPSKLVSMLEAKKTRTKKTGSLLKYQVDQKKTQIIWTYAKKGAERPCYIFDISDTGFCNNTITPAIWISAQKDCLLLLESVEEFSLNTLYDVISDADVVLNDYIAKVDEESKEQVSFDSEDDLIATLEMYLTELDPKKKLGKKNVKKIKLAFLESFHPGVYSLRDVKDWICKTVMAIADHDYQSDVKKLL